MIKYKKMPFWVRNRKVRKITRHDALGWILSIAMGVYLMVHIIHALSVRR